MKMWDMRKHNRNVCFCQPSRLLILMKNNYMEGPGSATMKLHSHSKAQRGKPSERKPHSYKLLKAEK